MRYSSSKSYFASYGTTHVSSSSSSSSYSRPSPAPAATSSSSDLHYKQDGSLDMRYNSSKQYVASHPDAAPAPKEKVCIAPPSYDHDLKVRKDGYLNMTTKANKEYAALPKDSNGNIIQTSQEAINFAKNHSLSQPPATSSFDFSSIIPISYSGSNTVVRTVLSNAKHAGTKNIGTITLYHATSTEAAKKIMEEKCFKPGKGGMFGAAMYFADKKQTARHKAAQGNDAIIVANVNMGKALIVEGPKHDLNIEQVKELGCDSVLGRSSSYAEWEYVVYDPSRIEPLSME
jgi:hypothetical protein